MNEIIEEIKSCFTSIKKNNFEKVEKILKRENYRKFEFFKDQFGKIRLVKISK